MNDGRKSQRDVSNGQTAESDAAGIARPTKISTASVLSGGQGGAPSVDPRPPVDASGKQETTHASPTVRDAVNAPAHPPAAALDGRPANVKVISGHASPLVTGGPLCPNPDLVYLESPAQTSPAPEGFTSVRGFAGTIDAPQVEQVMTDSLYVGGRPSPNDVQQGGIGDCYFLATLMSVAARDPGRIQAMMTSDGRGGAEVTFWRRTMTDPSWIKRAVGSKPKPEYSQVTIPVSEQLQYRLQTPLGSGQRIANTSGGFYLKGAQLRTAPQPGASRWWAQLGSGELEVHRRDEFDTALWAPLMEKAFAAFAERYGQYGGSQQESPAAGSGYAAINGGWSQQAMFVFYGAQADMAGANTGDVQQQPTQWAPGSQILAQNPRVVDQLLLLHDRGDQAQPGDKAAPVVTATSMVYALIPRLQAAITAAQADPDWAHLSPAEQTNVMSISVAITMYNAMPNTPPAPKTQARAAVGTACANAITLANAPNLLDRGRSGPIKSLVELVLDLKNIGTDNSPGQRNIYGDHVYSVVAVNFAGSTGAAVPLAMLPPAMRPTLFPQVDTTVSTITLRNPHHANTPDATGSGVGPDGPTQGPQSSGIFRMNLEQFFRNYTSVETGVFPRS